MGLINKNSRIAVVGNLCQNGYIIAKTLRKLGYTSVELFITCKNNFVKPAQDPRLYDNLVELPEWVKIFNTRPAWQSFIGSRKIFKNYSLVIAITLSPAYVQFFNKNFVAIATGSDLREFVFEKGIYNRLLKRAYRKAGHLFYLNPDHENAVRALGLEKSASFLPYPIEVEKINCSVYETEQFFSEFSVFWPSSWSAGLKGTDKFVAASRELLNSSLKMRMDIVDFSDNPEITAAEIKLVKDLASDFPNQIKLISRINNKEEFFKKCQSADLMVDQFNLGSYGALAVEAAAMGRPALTYLNPDYLRFFNNEPPPFLSAFSVADIIKQLTRFKRWDSVKSAAARRWALKWHGAESVVQKMLEKINAL